MPPVELLGQPLGVLGRFRREWKGKVHRRALALDARARRPDLATHRLDVRLADRQPQARSNYVRGDVAVQPHEALEDEVYLLRRYPQSVVAQTQLDHRLARRVASRRI